MNHLIRITQTVLLLAISATSAAGGDKPNFVIVIADDHGFHHSSVYGSPEFETPNMQSLASEGIHLTNAYVASPACAPSRAALFTGLMPYRNGIVGNHETELKPGVQSLIPLLIEQGYEVAFSGKVAHGRSNDQAYVPDEVNIIERDPRTDTRLKNVEAYLKNRTNRSRPLALFVGCVDTHTPWPNPDAARIDPADVVIPPRIFDTPESRVEMSRYIESAENVDRKLGTIRKFAADYLDPANTMTVYTSDHGLAWPFGKWSLYEAGIRTPFIATWPGKIKAGSTNDAMVSWIDVIPTLIDLAGGSSSPDIDGRSFAKVLTGHTGQHRDVIFATHKGDKTWNVYPIRSVRKGPWKYILNLHPEFANTTHTDILSDKKANGGQHWPSYIEAAKTNPDAAAFLHDFHSSPAEELYDVVNDPFEQKNLAESPQHAERLAELRDIVANRMVEVGDDKSLSGKPRLLKDFTLPSLAGNKVFDEVDGTVIMEMESTQSSLGKWNKRATLKPFTGTGYLEFMGNNPGLGPATSPLKYDFRINTPGDYWLSIRSHKRLTGDDGVTARNDMCNDCFVRVEGDYTSADPTLPPEWLKNDMKFWGNAQDMDWKNWSNNIVGDHDAIKTVRYNFKAGKQYRLVVSGRAQRFSLDRIVITRVGDQRFNETDPESRLVEK